MNLVVVSQCAKNALTETRRVLDQFAERSGHRTWIFESTELGQQQIRKMLKRTARKNTAVICYHIKKAGGKEILWLVGNPRRFNDTGAVPTNSTGRDMLGSQFENSWHHLQAIKIITGIAGLFHDVGKANAMFQKKLKGGKRTSEPVRHEWLSLLIFEAFVNGADDADWINRLAEISPDDEAGILQCMTVNQFPTEAPKTVIVNRNPFKNRLKTPLSQIIGWLIVSHHRLPVVTAGQDSLDNINHWLVKIDQMVPGNSPQVVKDDWKPKDWQDILDFKTGTPLKSETWCSKANRFARRLLKLDLPSVDWMQDPFVMHLSRLSLMLSDHLYSSQLPTKAWQDRRVKSLANTFFKDAYDEQGEIIGEKGKPKQKLDEHNIGVANQGFIFPNMLPNLQRDLPSFSYCKPLKKFASHRHFQWQNKAFQMAAGLRERSQAQGFIAFNMASTGRGKTLGNAKIMYALADEKQGCRFSVALGLRTLTLQTGDAFKEKLQLNDEDIAVMIGSQAVLNLHKRESGEAVENQQQENAGSESLSPLFREHETIHYEGVNAETRLNKWLAGADKAEKMLNAPILVSTIDHLIPATDGCRGGKQIAPMLRLLTSDLILDEPDDFGLEDLPALCRLVNWAGMLGARVLLSSATIPPDLAAAVFAAYHEGRKHYRRNCLPIDTDATTLTAWFDEDDCTFQEIADDAQIETAYQTTSLKQFELYHKAFVNKRIAYLQKQSARPSGHIQFGQIVPLEATSTSPQDAIAAISSCINTHLPALHSHHGCEHPQSKGSLSLGLVRMANIKQLVAVAKHLMASGAPEGLNVQLLIYHSRLPLIIRSNIEKQLDKLFNRENDKAIWQNPLIQQTFKARSNDRHMILVLASPVCEVGRNWDADFAICEPSSFRSIIQLAGRVNRHRREPVSQPNVLLLNQNYRGLTRQRMAFTRPGFENEEPFNLSEPKDLLSKTQTEQIHYIGAIPRIAHSASADPTQNIAELEHAHTKAMLFGLQDSERHFSCYAARWWQNPISWCQWHQQQRPFRKSQPEQPYFFYLEDEDAELQFCTRSDSGDLLNATAEALHWGQDDDLQMGQGIGLFYQQDLKQEILNLAEELDMDVSRCSEIYSQVSIDESRDWSYQPALGLFNEL